MEKCQLKKASKASKLTDMVNMENKVGKKDINIRYKCASADYTGLCVGSFPW